MNTILTEDQIEFWSKKLLVPAGWPVRSIAHTDDGVKITIGGLHWSGTSYPTIEKTATYAEIMDFRNNELRHRPARRWQVEYRCWAWDGSSGGPTIVYGFTSEGLSDETVKRRAASQTGCRPAQIRIEDVNYRA